jgi:squalene-hopene/tetraprenyl-beta-curcumene cyclase
VFVERCQNFAEDARAADPRFDDGGFFFRPNDPAKNKAGVAGKDRHGRERYASYGGMTADGMRALLACGVPRDHPRIVAAHRWLERSFTVEQNPGRFAADREVIRDATDYYYCRSVAMTFERLKLREVATPAGKVRWAEALVEELIRRQRPDGAWVNRYTDTKEDDPLVSTPSAVAALAVCRRVIAGG